MPETVVKHHIWPLKVMFLNRKMPESTQFWWKPKSMFFTCRSKIVALCIVTEYQCDSFRAVGSQISLAISIAQNFRSSIYVLQSTIKWELVTMVCRRQTEKERENWSDVYRTFEQNTYSFWADIQWLLLGWMPPPELSREESWSYQHFGLLCPPSSCQRSALSAHNNTFY